MEKFTSIENYTSGFDNFDTYLKNLILENCLDEDEDEDIKWILEVINDMMLSGTIESGVGYCLAMSDLLQKLLQCNNIESELVECSLAIIDSNFSPPNLTMIGYENKTKIEKNKMQNHVVLVTKTKTPLLIDLSVFDIVKNVPYAIGIVKENKSIQLASLVINNAVFKYSKKPTSSIPYLHQQSITNRIELDNKITNNFNKIQKLIAVLFVISSVNLLRGSFDFYQKYINTSNGFGPVKSVIAK